MLTYAHVQLSCCGTFASIFPPSLLLQGGETYDTAIPQPQPGGDEPSSNSVLEGRSGTQPTSSQCDY